MRVLVSAVGSMGNALPFIGWGRFLKDRGHEVIVLGSPYLASVVEGFQLGFVPVDSQEPNADTGAKQRPRQTIALLRQLSAEVRPFTRRLFQAIAQEGDPGRTVVIATSWHFGARLARESFGYPLITAVLQPSFLPKQVPQPVRRWIRDRVVRLLERRIRRPIEELRQEFGLAPLQAPLSGWAFSPDAVVGLFPDWFCPRDVRWPSQTVATEFPRFDHLQSPERPDELEQFLNQGDPPIVISQSSLVSHPGKDEGFQTEIEAVRRIGRRAILLSADPRRLPSKLPAEIRHFGFIPLSEILPRSCAFVHHGGLGSLAQGLAAGVPQITIPRFMDQPENSRTLEALGVSRNLRPRGLTARQLAAELEQVLSDDDLARRCRDYQERTRSALPFKNATNVVERIGRMHGLSP